MRCGARTWSRQPCCDRCRTTCGRRSPRSPRPPVGSAPRRLDEPARAELISVISTRVGPAHAAGRQPARPLARPSRTAQPAGRLDLGRGADRGGDRARRDSASGVRARNRAGATAVRDRLGPARARARQLGRERGALRRRRAGDDRAPSASADEVAIRITDHGPGVPPRRPRADLRAVSQLGRPRRAPGSAWRSRAASSRPTAASCAPSRCPARARRSSIQPRR